MSHSNVERVVGRLVTDEAFRRRFADDPRAALAELREQGLRLTECEEDGLAALDSGELARFADGIDPRLFKCDLRPTSG